MQLNHLSCTVFENAQNINFTSAGGTGSIQIIAPQDKREKALNRTQFNAFSLKTFHHEIKDQKSKLKIKSDFFETFRLDLTFIK
jgi:hypothetical protein